MINGKKTNNTANMVGVRQRFGGNIQMYCKESKYLGRSTTQFTLYKMLPYLYRSGRPTSIFPDQFDTLQDVIHLDNAYVYRNPTDPDSQDFRRGGR